MLKLTFARGLNHIPFEADFASQLHVVKNLGVVAADSKALHGARIALFLNAIFKPRGVGEGKACGQILLNGCLHIEAPAHVRFGQTIHAQQVNPQSCPGHGSAEEYCKSLVNTNIHKRRANKHNAKGLYSCSVSVTDSARIENVARTPNKIQPLLINATSCPPSCISCSPNLLGQHFNDP